MQISSSRYSILSIALILVFCGGRLAYSGKVQSGAIIESDARGYCAYLAATLVLGDPLLKNYEQLDWDDRARFWVYPSGNGAHHPKFTMGLALIMAPFYLVAHGLCILIGLDANGWSTPYQFSVALSGLTLFALGLMSLAFWLRIRFSDVVVAITLALTFWATNAVLYATDAIAMSHIYVFSLLSICLWSTEKWIGHQRIWHLIITVISASLILLIRPTNIVLILLPFYLLASGWREGRWGIRSITPAVIIVCLMCSGVILIPQLVYWKLVSGQWLFYTYGAEKLFVSRPHLVEGLFSYRNGWLLYTPIMLFAVPGFWMLWKRQGGLSIAAGVALILHCYLVFSWWCWYYGGSWSIRPMVDAYPICALALAAFTSWVIAHKKWLWAGFLAIALILVANNTIQYKHHLSGALHFSDMTGRAFWKLFMNPQSQGDMQLLGYYQAPDVERLMLGLPERKLTDTLVLVGNESLSGEWKAAASDTYSLRKGGFGPSLNLSIEQLNLYQGKTLEITYPVRSADFSDGNPSAVAECDGFYGGIPLRTAYLSQGQWDTVHVFLKLPIRTNDAHQLKCYVWMPESGEVEGGRIQARIIDCRYAEGL